MPLPSPVLGKDSPWRVAYVARVYHRAGDRRLSHHQVYLCDLHGGHRRQVTRGPHECRVVRWLDHATLAWTRDDGTLWRMRVDGGRPTLWKRTKAGWIDRSLPNELRLPGEPVFPLDRSYRYAKGKLTPIDNAGGWVGAAPGCDVRRDEQTDELIDGKGRPVLPTSRSGESVATAFSGPAKGDLWVMGWSSMSSWGEYYRLSRYDRRTGRVLWQRDENEDLDFRPDRTRYARTTVRNVSPLGKVGVWTAATYVGDWRTNREWPITKGLVEAWTISLRP